MVPFEPAQPRAVVHVPMSGFKVLPDIVVFLGLTLEDTLETFKVSRLSNCDFRMCVCLIYISQDSKNV